MGNLICFDAETGGLTNQTSLLTVWFGILNKNFELVDELDLKLIPDNGVYVVNPEAMAVNKIDLVELASQAITYKDAKTQLYKFLERNFNGEKLTPIGQNVLFDVMFVKDVIISAGSWDNFVTHRVLDTMLIARFLQVNGILNVESVSLGALIEHFGIIVEGNAHEAKYDALATAEVYKKLVELVKQPLLAVH